MFNPRRFALSLFGVLLATLLCRSATSAEPALLPTELYERGWIQLFDGETLFGWRPTGEAEWRVVKGMIHTNGDKPGFLMTTTHFADYELTLEFQAGEETNSGIFLRTSLEPIDPARDCYELNIAPADNPFPTGSLVARRKVAPQEGAGARPGEWHTFRVVAHAGRISVHLDDEPVLTFDDPTPLGVGHIALQSNKGPVLFRNIRLRPLGLKSIFNGQDLTGWNMQQALEGKFEVTPDGELHVTNGRGQLETDGQYTNFILQLECKVRGDGLNSGIFFRAQPDRLGLGYESQISNAFKDGDRTKPADYGTGGIYRRQPARRVVADDHEWFTKTLVANGAHFAVWVNGYQVTDWRDYRPANDNPREGLRLAGGILAIQAHDPTTDLLFRNLRIAELPRR